MGELLARILPLAFGAALSPLIAAILVVTLSGPSHPRGRAIAFTAGMGTALVLVSILGFTLLKGVVIPSLADPSTTLAALDLAFGAGLALIVAIRLVRPPTEASPGRVERAAAPRLERYYLLGLARMGTNVTSLVLFIPAVKDVAASSVGPVGEIVALATVILVTMLPALIPVTADLMFPDEADRVLRGLDRWLREHGRTLVTAVLGALAGYLIVRGAISL
jgi:hypothetical protein